MTQLVLAERWGSGSDRCFRPARAARIGAITVRSYRQNSIAFAQQFHDTATKLVVASKYSQ